MALTDKCTQEDIIENEGMEDEVGNGEITNGKVLNGQDAQEKVSYGGDEEEEANQASIKEELRDEDLINEELKIEEGMNKQVPTKDGLKDLPRDGLITEDVIMYSNDKDKAINGSDSKGINTKKDIEEEGASQENIEEKYVGGDTKAIQDKDEQMNEGDAEEEDINEGNAEEEDVSEGDAEEEGMSEGDAEEEDMSEEDAEEEVMTEEDTEDEAMSQEDAEVEAVSQEDAEDDGLSEDPEEDVMSLKDNKRVMNEVVECKKARFEEQKVVEATKEVDNDKRVAKNEEKDVDKSKGKGKTANKMKRKILSSRGTTEALAKHTEDWRVKKGDNKNDAAMNDILKRMVSNEKKGASESVGNVIRSNETRKEVASRLTTAEVAKHVEEEDRTDEECKDQGAMNKSKQKGVVKNEENCARGAMKASHGLRRRNKRKRSRGTNEAIAKDADESILKETKEKIMGMIFMCSSKTKADCYNYKVLGLPPGKRDMVLKIYKGMKLFLYDFDLKLMYGIYEAAAPGGYNVEPNAFKSAFPSQVRFRVSEDCLPVAEENFRNVLKDNYYTKKKFDCQLNAEQVKNLCNLLRAAGRAPRPKQSHNDRGKQSWRSRAELHSSLVQEKSRKNPLMNKNSRRKRRRQEEGRDLSRHGQYQTGAVTWETEIYERPVARLPVHHLPPPSPPACSSFDPYGRTLDRDVYRHHRVSGRYERHNFNLGPRREDEMTYADPYVSHQQYQAPREPLYSAGSQTHYRRVDPLPEYYSSGLSPERNYRSRLYRY